MRLFGGKKKGSLNSANAADHTTQLPMERPPWMSGKNEAPTAIAPVETKGKATPPVKRTTAPTANQPNKTSTVREQQQKEQQTPTTTGCCGRFRAEFGHPAFSQEEVTGRAIHGPETFGPTGRMILLVKTLLMGWSVSLLIQGLMDMEFETFYFAFLTNTTLSVATVYLSMSWFHTMHGTVRPSVVQESTEISFFHKFTWALYAVAAPGEVVVMVGYWGMDWQGDVTAALDYRNLMVHGGILVVLLVEGLLVNRIPLRPRHFGLLFLYLLVYMIWTLVHAFFLDIGDPTSQDDDTIYDSLQWKSDPAGTALLAAFFFFGLAPASFLVVYVLSLPCGCCSCTDRRYVKGPAEPDATVSSYVEMHGVNGSSSSYYRNIGGGRMA